MKKLIAMAAAAFMTACVPTPSSATAKAAEMIRQFEGFRPTVYTCAAGKPTIGYGFTAAELIEKGSMTEAEARTELNRICADISRRLKEELGEENALEAHEEAAIISFIYNIGWGRFKASSLCRLLKAGSRGAVIGVELRKWVYIGKQKSKGLAKRRAAEAEVFLCGW